MTKLLRYFFVGGAAASFDLLFFIGFHNGLGFHYLAVGVIGFVLATLLNYVLSVRWVFKSGVRFERNAEVFMVYLVSTIGLAIHATVLVALVELAGIVPLAGKLGAVAAAFFWNFGARNYYVFAEAR
jgi:putative flippase GtrA